MFHSRRALVDALHNFDVYGGFVIPSDFSSRMLDLGTTLASGGRTDMTRCPSTRQ